MKYQYLYFKGRTCLLCQERTHQISCCQHCSYFMCIDCYQTYINYNYTICPQCRNQISENDSSTTNHQFKINFNLPLHCSYTTHQERSSCLVTTTILNLGILFLILVSSYWIGFLITKNHEVFIVINIILGFIVIILSLLLLFVIHNICCL